MIKRQYTLYLENRPGMLANIAGMLAKKNVNIEGISVAESTDAALVQVIVDRETAARRALVEAKIPFTSQDVSVLVLPHRPGALASLTAKLAKARININYIYATAADDDSQCCMVVSANDLKGVERIGKRV